MEQTIHWRDLLRALPDVAWVKDLLGQYQACNLRFETLLGLSEAAILGKTDQDLKTPALSPFFDALRQNQTAPQQFEVTFAQDQHQEYLEVQQIPIHNAHKQAIGSLGIGRNITYLHELLESMQDGFVALDADWRYRYVNQRAAQFLNHSPASLLGKNIWQVFPEGVGESFEAAYHTAMNTRQTLRIESYFAPWRCWFENRIYPTQTGISIFFTDITEQKERELQEQLRLNMFEKLLQGEPLQAILAALITAYEQLFPETVCSILLVNTRNQTLNRGVAPHLPEYISKALDKLPLTSGKGPCCTAALTGKSVTTENIQNSAWSENYKALLHKAGLAACWSEPILGTDKEVLGTFAIYRAQVGLPSEAEKKFIASVVQLASLALERNKTTHLLSESENSYRTLINTIPDLVWLKDPQGRYLMCNSRFEAFCGSTEARLKGKTDFDFVERELAEFFRAHDQAVLNAGKSLSNEEELTFQSDGYTGIFETIKTPMFSQEGEVLGVLGVARDISKTKSALQSLQEREALIATMFNQTTDSILLVNPETQKFVDFNDTACQNLGYSREEFSQLHVGDIQAALGPDKRGQLVRAVQSGQSFNFETHHRRKDGSLREIELTLRPIALAGEKLISAVWRDITEAKEAKAELARYHHHLEELVNSRTQALQASEYRFRKLVEDIKQDYIFFSVGEGQCITYLSPSAEEFLGQKMEAMLGKPWYEVFQLGASAQNLGEQIMLQMQKGETPPPFEIEVELRGQKQTLEITEHIRYSPTGNLIGGEGVIKNITRQKRIEVELREAKDKAEKASQAKSLFLANMSHEIRTPLNVILGFSEMMQEKIQDSRYQNFLQAINSSGKTLLNIINDILDLSKIEAGKLQLTLQNVSLKALFQDLEILLRFSFEKKGLNFRLILAEDLPPLLLLDALRLRQILLNLLYNALKFTHTGEVCLSASYQALNPESGELCLRVKDTGIGIAPEFQERIFEAFEQAENENEFSGGTGLGLAISMQLIKLMQGKLTLESALGKGSTFQIVLPQVKKAPETTAFKPEKTDANERAFEFAPAKLLVADDVPQNLDLLQAYLETSPLQIKTAQNGQEAYEQALSDLPDLILMDIKMPVLNGIETLELLKANPKTRAIPVVALTAYSLRQERESLLNKGFDGYLQKPISKDELLDCLKTFLKGQTHAPHPEARPTPIAAQTPTFEQDSPEQLEQFQTLLEQDWLPRWKDIQDSLILDELESFAQDLITLAEHHKQPTLKDYAKQLLNDVESFVLESAQERLKAFPNLVQGLNRAGQF